MITRLTTLLAISALTVAGQQSDPLPAAQTLGPQSGLETYDAPTTPFEQLTGEIDFPTLIAAPGANDEAVVAPALRQLRIEIIGTQGGEDIGSFLTIVGETRARDDRVALYTGLHEILRPYANLPLTLGDLRFLQRDINEVYRETGYPLMAVVVPPQEVVDGVLRLQVNEFSLHQYRVQFGDGQGSYATDAEHWTDRPRLGRLLDPLLAEPILRKAALDAKVKALNVNPARSARVIFEPGQQIGESIAVFQIDEQRTWSVQAGYNNHATESSGEHRFSLGGSLTNLPVENHQLSWMAVVAPDPAEFQNYSLVYTVPNHWGHRFTANVNFSDTAASAVPPVGSASTTLQTSLRYELPVLQTPRLNWNLSAQAALKQFERESLFDQIVVAGAEFDGVQLVINNVFNFKEPTATNQLVAGLAMSFEGLTDRNTDANFRRFYNYVNGEAATQHLTINYARVQQLGPLVAALEGWNAETQLSWQLTSDRLGGSDTFALGGARVLRAYQSSEVFGDQGYYAVQSLAMPPLKSAGLQRLGIDQIRLSAFAEAGHGDPKVGASSTLWDIGLGAQVAAAGGRFSANASLAFAGEATPQTERGDVRFFIGAALNY